MIILNTLKTLEFILKNYSSKIMISGLTYMLMIFLGIGKSNSIKNDIFLVSSVIIFNFGVIYGIIIFFIDW